MSDMEIKEMFGKIMEMMTDMQAKFRGFEVRIDGLSASHDKLVSKVIDMETYMHTELATKAELAAVKEDLTSQLDVIAQQTSMHEAERVAAQHRMERLEHRVDKLEARPGNA